MKSQGIRPLLFLLTCAIAALALPSTALAGTPSAFPDEATATGATTATLNGDVAANGETTSVHFDWDTAGSGWCMSGGGTGSAAHSTPAQSVPSTFSGPVAADISGLTAGADYCFTVVATNPSGTDTGFTLGFTAGAPAADVSSVLITGGQTATVSGEVNPSGQTTTYRADYDAASSPWCQTASGSPTSSTSAQTLGATDTQPHSVSVPLTGLTAGTEYCVQIVAVNGSATARSFQLTFTAGLPDASTFDAESTAAATADVTGAVNPSGQATTYRVDYDVSTSSWCTNFGASGSPAHSTSEQPLAETDSDSHDVTVGLAGLAAGTQYCAEIVATNASGAARGGLVQFEQGVPQAETFETESLDAGSERVFGAINPTGQSTTYKVDYDVSTAAWCTSDGASGSPAHATTPTALTQTDSAFHTVQVDLTGLSSGTQYCAEIVATNASGVARGGQISFVAGVPQAVTFGADSTGASTATINGLVNPSGQSTTYKVDYDVSTATWCTSHGISGSPAHSTTPATLPQTDSTGHDVDVGLTGLTPGTAYCAEVVAQNGSGTARGGQTTFTAGAPQADIFDAFATGASTATVEGGVNPGGQSTNYRVDFDTTTSTWCSSSGTSGSPAHATTDQPLAETDTTFHDVTVNLSGLTAGTSYCAEIVATNPAGPVRSGQIEFTAGTPGVSTFEAHATGQTTAAASGAINPSGQSTTYRAKFAVQGSAFCNSGGNSGSPTTTSPDQTLGATDSQFHDVTVSLTGLTAGTTYCVLIEGTNASGTTRGDTEEFVAGTPSVSLSSLASAGPTSEEVAGTVNPAGQTTNYHFEYGAASSAWCSSNGTSGSAPSSTTSTPLGFTDSTEHAVTATLGGLTTGQAYCVRMVATNNSGTVATDTGTFTAGGGGGEPSAATNPATQIAVNGATLNGTVNPANDSTDYEFEYDAAGSSFCTGSGVPAHVTSTATLGFTDNSAHAVDRTVVGLVPETSYCYRVVAHNSSGDDQGSKVTFTTGSLGGGNDNGGTSGTGGNGSNGGSNGGNANAPASVKKAGSAKLLVSGSTLTLDAGITAACPAGAGPCSGTGEVSAVLPKAAAAAKKKKAKRVVLGKAKLTIASGKSVKAKIKLSSKGAKLLRKYKRLKVTITVIVKTKAGKVSKTSRTVTLKAPAKKSKKH